MTETDPYAEDPFFRRVFDGNWNACIGRQGHEENYLDGYIDAAIELADAIIDKQLFAKRDTLVLPILYNARHAIELALKFVTDRLVRAGPLKSDGINGITTSGHTGSGFMQPALATRNCGLPSPR